MTERSEKYQHVKTLDELIEALEECREEIGGDTPVKTMSGPPGEFVSFRYWADGEHNDTDDGEIQFG